MAFDIRNLKNIYSFFGKKVSFLFVSGIAIGLSLFAIEVAFAFGLQAFLLSIGVMNHNAVTLPKWFPVTDLKFVLCYILSTGLLRGFFQWLQLYTQGLAQEYMSHIQRSRLLRWTFHSESVSTSEATSLFGERVNRTSAGTLNLQALLVASTSVCFLGLSLFIMMPLLTSGSVLALVILALMLRWTDHKVKESGEGASVEWDRTNRRMLVSIKNLLLMQIYGTQREEEEKTQHSLQNYTNHALVYYRYSAFKFAITQVVGVILICTVTLLSQSMHLAAPGILITYFYLFVRFLQTFSAANLSFSSLLQNWPHMVYLHHWWDHHSFDGKTNRRFIPKNGPIFEHFQSPIGWQLKNVTFSYGKNERSVIHNLNLTVEPAKVLVITGPSGVGKSTLLNLMIGGIAPSEGRIDLILENQQLKPLAEMRSRLLSSIGYVGAESFLIEGTIYENIVYGLPFTPSSEEIHDALSKSECQFVLSLPLRLKTFLTEQGQGLSAGQKQRLSLTRAILRKPRALILDEATANLDIETEARLLETFSKLRGQMTLIVVTHRQTVLKIADHHLNLETQLDTSKI